MHPLLTRHILIAGLAILAQALFFSSANAQTAQADPPPVDPPLPAYCPITTISPGLLDSCYGYTTFGLGYGPNNYIKAMATQRNGYLVAVGVFTTWDGLSRNSIARIKPSGIADRNFRVGNGFNGSVSDVAVLPSGKIMACGDFTEYQDLTAQYLVRLDSTGARDATFSIPTFSAPLKQINGLPDGKVLVLGDFIAVNGRVWPQMARLHADGSLDTTFRITNTTLPLINYFDTQSDGKVVISAVGVNAVIARLNADGSDDSTFTPVPANRTRIKVLTDDAILAYSQLDVPATLPSLMKLTPGGVIDTAFTTFSGGDVYDVEVDSAGKLYISTIYQDTLTGVNSGILKFNADGSPDPTFAPGAGNFGTVYLAIGYTQVPRMYYFSLDREVYQDALLNQLNTIDLDGNRIEDFQNRPDYFDNVVNSFQRTYKNKVLVNGRFYGVGQNPTPGVAILKSNGLPDADFYIGTAFAKTISQPDGNLMGVNASQLNRFDTLGHTMSGIILPGNPQFTTIFSIENGNALVSADDNYMLRIRANGQIDTAFNSLAVGCGAILAANVLDAVSLPGGRILVAGAYPKRLVLIDSTGFVDSAFDLNLPFAPGPCSSERMKVLRQPDGRILVSGAFRLGSSTNTTYICRLLPNGLLDTSFHFRTGNTTTSISGMALMPDGKIMVGGQGELYAKLERLLPNGDNDPLFSLRDDGIDGQVYTILPDGNAVLIGGDFTRVSGKPRLFAARVFTEGAVIAVKEMKDKPSALRVWPNPTAGMLRVETNHAAELLTLDGRSLQTANATNNTAVLTLSSLPKGLYLVRSAGKVVRVAKE